MDENEQEEEKAMQTSVIGFPRIGTLRELKFASEKYFRNEIKAEELLQTAKDLRKAHWMTQKEAGITFISSNDFSHYDLVLDTAVLLGIVPKRYQELQLSALDTYFAMARGYQGTSGDVKALAMKKWFNTNYHYIVPEAEDDTVIHLSASKLFDEYAEAKELGIATKPVVIGAYTMLKLCRFTGEKKAEDFIGDLTAAYQELLKECQKQQIAWVQFDEPALVRDMDAQDVELFHRLYDAVLQEKGNCRVLVQTYFGDVRDVYQDLTAMDFDGIGLDFLEGKETVRLIEAYGFPADKILFAGLVNGKNIWKNHYEKTLQTVKGLQEKNISVVLSTSCSLLHVPYTLKHETKLPKECSAYFAFAEEKLTEQIGLAQTELTYIDSVFESLALAENERDLNEIRAELAEQGYVRRKAGKKNQKQPALSAPLKFKTSDGFTVLVGRNNRQNDKLTMKDANNNDIWFHTKNIPGSHTVLVTDGKAPTETAMEEAAVLAAQHSRAKDSAQVPVDYTQIRYVSKPQGAKPGMVIYVQYKTVYVDPTTESKAKQQS